jgi:hypothetical protein
LMHLGIPSWVIVAISMAIGSGLFGGVSGTFQRVRDLVDHIHNILVILIRQLSQIDENEKKEIIAGFDDMMFLMSKIPFTKSKIPMVQTWKMKITAIPTKTIIIPEVKI